MFATKHRHAVWTTKHCGKVAGGIRRPVKGPAYRFIRIGAAQYQAHRLVWLHVHGESVPDMIDHQDRDPLNNRLKNLRAATRAQNRANSRPSTKLGVKGVYARGHRFYAMAGKTYLGTFTTIAKPRPLTKPPPQSTCMVSSRECIIAKNTSTTTCSP